MEFRLIFDTIPAQFDKWRGRYCAPLFDDLIALTHLDEGKTVLELGPGTGQATEPILATRCNYYGIELGPNFAHVLRQKYGQMSHFHLIEDDFITHDFGSARFDLIMSAATIQWIPEEIAYRKTLSLLRPGGTLAMMLTSSDYRTPNEALYARIQQVYSDYFHPAQPYTSGQFHYLNAAQYGFEPVQRHEYVTRRVFTADDFVQFTGTHCDHLTLCEPDKTLFFCGLRDAINAFGGTLTSIETHKLFLARKPLASPGALLPSAREPGAL